VVDKSSRDCCLLIAVAPAQMDAAACQHAVTLKQSEHSCRDDKQSLRTPVLLIAAGAACATHS
jgi:hypothetical protein